jgi:5'-3' exonuclease
MKLHLVDGTFEIFRCFHGAPRATVAGREVGACRALAQTMAALLRQEDVTHVAVVFDRAVAPVRVVGTTEEGALQSQFGLAADVVRALGIAVWPMIRFQADEGLASGAVRFRDAVDQVVICTTDKDLMQCVVGERIVVFDRVRKVLTDEAGVRARFGVAPAQLPDFFALVGDRSDGLPGIPGWGPRSAAVVLERYGRVEDIPERDWDVEIRGADRLAATLNERRLEAILYRDLSIRRTDVPIPHALEDLRWRGPNERALDEVLRVLDDASVRRRIPPPR